MIINSTDHDSFLSAYLTAIFRDEHSTSHHEPDFHLKCIVQVRKQESWKAQREWDEKKKSERGSGAEEALGEKAKNADSVERSILFATRASELQACLRSPVEQRVQI